MIRSDKRYTSNTLAGSANQNWFSPEDPSAVHTGRVFYQLFAGGRYGYSFLYSNRMDTTFADGSHSHAGRCGKPWTIRRLMAGICSPSVDPAAITTGILLRRTNENLSGSRVCDDRSGRADGTAGGLFVPGDHLFRHRDPVPHGIADPLLSVSARAVYPFDERAVPGLSAVTDR